MNEPASALLQRLAAAIDELAAVHADLCELVDPEPTLDLDRAEVGEGEPETPFGTEPAG